MLGLDPYHFNQVTSTLKRGNVCSTPVKQWAWQEAGQIGREDMAQAIQAAEESDLVRRCLGDHVFESLIRNKTIEWNDYRTHVTDFERERYLAVL